MGDRACIWLPEKYLILCYSQSLSCFLLCLKLSTVLSYSNKHFKLPSLCSIYVPCGNTAQTGFVPGDRHSRDTGARHSPGERHHACACLSPRATSRSTHQTAYTHQGKAKLPEMGSTEDTLLGSGLPEGDGKYFSLWLEHSYSHCNHLPQNSFSQTGAFIQSLKMLAVATVFAQYLHR